LNPIFTIRLTTIFIPPVPHIAMSIGNEKMPAGIIFLPLLLLLLAGCSGTTDIDIKPSRLTPIKSPLAIHPVWYKQAQNDLATMDSYLKPVIDDGKIYIAGQSGSVRALDMETGKRIWKVNTGVSLSGGLGVGKNLILVGTHDGEVLALNQNNGGIMWRVQLSSEVLTPPVAANDVVVARTVDGRLNGLNESDGKRLWVYESTVPTLTLRGASQPVISDGKVLTGFSNGKVVAVALADGKFLWEMTVAVPEGRSELERLVDIDGDPVLMGDILYVVSYQGRLVAINISNGRLLWSRDISSYSGLAVDNNNLYISDNESTLWALDRFNGAIIWKQDKLKLRSLTAPVLYKEYIVVGDFAGYLHWITRLDGRIAARRKVSDQSVFVPPVVRDNILFTTDLQGMLVALESK